MTNILSTKLCKINNEEKKKSDNLTKKSDSATCSCVRYLFYLFLMFHINNI